MIVKSLTWCSVTVVAIVAAALLTTAPVSAHSDDDYQNTQSQNENNTDKDDKKFTLKDPILSLETGACVFEGQNQGTIGVVITNPNSHKVTYKVTVGGKEKSVTVGAGQTEYTAFTRLSIGDYAVTVEGPHGTTAEGSATIKECHERELPTVNVDACGCTDDHDGRLTLTIENTNDYAVTYTVSIDGHRKDVFVDAHSANTVSFGHLAAGEYQISVSGDDCTDLCLHATVEQCPEPEQPGQGSGDPTPTTPEEETPVEEATPVEQTETLPVELPDTSARESTSAVTATATVVAQTPKTVNISSLALIALGLPMIAAAAVLRRQQHGNNA